MRLAQPGGVVGPWPVNKPDQGKDTQQCVPKA